MQKLTATSSSVILGLKLVTRTVLLIFPPELKLTDERDPPGIIDLIAPLIALVIAPISMPDVCGCE